MSKLLEASAISLARLIREGHVSPIEVVDAHIARMEDVNPPLNAVVVTRFAKAREEARQAQERLQQKGPRPPLLGVPFTAKEFAAVAGLPHTGGIVSRRDVVATEDATVIRRLRNAGAILLGLTNAPEGGLWHETNNRIYGRTNNPWDTDRTCGGSSGGEAAIIAAGASPFGIGSDIGGSVRIPAAFCGICSHKPTGRTIPSTGHFPAAPHGHNIHPFTFGPMTRCVEDLMPLLEILAGPDGRDANTVARVFGNPGLVDPKKLVVYPVETNGRFKPTPAIVRAIRRATRILEGQGARVEELDLSGMKRGFEIWSAVLSEVGATYAEIVDHPGGRATIQEVLRYLFGRSRHTGPVLTMLVVERLLKKLPGQVEKMVQEAHQLRREFDEKLGSNGVVLYPAFTRGAPRHRAIIFKLTDPECTAIFNILEAPVTVIPMGNEGHELPIGLQIAARRGNDHLTIGVAQLLEQEVGRWRPVTPHSSQLRLRLAKREPPAEPREV